jgi:thiosulfate sulfurtransferase
MKKKIIGILVFFMLSIPAISALDTNSSTETVNEVESQNLQENLSMEIYRTPVFFGVNLDITNEGTTTLNDIDWSFRTKAAITGTGIFIRENLRMGTIDELMPGETVTLKFRPLNLKTKSPIGLGNLYMNASAEVNGEYVRTQQRAFLLGFIIMMYKDTYMDIKPPEAYQRYLNNEFDLIIDVVGLDIYSLGHLPGAVNYVWADGTLRDKIPDLDPSWTYLVYCHTDPPSTASAQLLVDSGFEHIYRLEGNYAAWKNAGYPIET